MLLKQNSKGSQPDHEKVREHLWARDVPPERLRVIETLNGGARGLCGSLAQNHVGCCIVAEFNRSERSQADLGATERALVPLLALWTRHPEELDDF